MGTLKGIKTMKVKPCGSRVLVLPEQVEEKSAGGIIIPDAHKKESQFGVVLELGESNRDKQGNVIDWPCKVGDRVMVSKYGGIEVKADKLTLKMFDASDILAVLVMGPEDQKPNQPEPVKRDLSKAVIGVDGDCGFALLGADLQSGEAEFVKVNLEDIKANEMTFEQAATAKATAQHAAAKTAFEKLKTRLKKPELECEFHESHPYFGK